MDDLLIVQVFVPLHLFSKLLCLTIRFTFCKNQHQSDEFLCNLYVSFYVSNNTNKLTEKVNVDVSEQS